MKSNAPLKLAILTGAIFWIIATLLELAWFNLIDRGFVFWFVGWIVLCECLSLSYFLRLRRPVTGAILGFVIGLIAAATVPELLLIAAPASWLDVDL
jgi:hypothetical protein